jgi:hypothetical protein
MATAANASFRRTLTPTGSDTTCRTARTAAVMQATV